MSRFQPFKKRGGSGHSGSGDARKKILAGAGIAAGCALLVGALCLFSGKEPEVTFRILEEADIPQQIASEVIPEYRTLERALACVVDGKVYVLASRGEKPAEGYEISIEGMELESKEEKTNLVIHAVFRDPQQGTSVSQKVTYPLQVAETDLKELPDSIELKVQYKE